MRETAFTSSSRAAGFTLVELAVVVLIITLLLGSILVPLSTQVEQRQISETQKALDRIRDAILGYAVTFGYLPCPDLTTGGGSNDGQEDVTGSNCTSAEGNVPWATLGVDNADPWGNRYRYRVDTDFTNRATRFSLTTSADLQICATQACAVELTSTTAGNRAVAVILSHGRNGFGAINSVTNAANPAAASPDEQENADNDTRFVSRAVAGALGSTAGEFDDIVTWLSKYTLYNRMVAAGKLP
jgi:type II secretory pathway pseudopilin PulG